MDIVTLPLVAAVETFDTAIRRLNEEKVRMLVVAASNGGYRVHRSKAVLDGWRRRYVAIGELEGGDRVVVLRGAPGNYSVAPPSPSDYPFLEEFLDEASASFGLIRPPKSTDRVVTLVTRHEGITADAKVRTLDCVCQKWDTHNDQSPPSKNGGSCPTCGSGWVCA